MPRLLNILGFLAFVIGAVVVAVGIHVLITGVIGWNPLRNARPLQAGLTTVLVLLGSGAILLVAGWLLGQAGARAEWRREIQATVVP
jgi:uncharacterized membrane protein YhiD involved in acid resistance